jgi:hypothetical protein
MLVERRRAAWCQCALVLASLAGCAQIDPQVGPSQESCGTGVAAAGATAGNSGYGGAGTSAYGASAATSQEQACTPDAGSPCDVCESTYCCMTRLACYRDPVCLCADQALDKCFETAGKAGASAQQGAACRDAFSAHGAVEQARMACQQAWCAAACAVP